MAWKVPQPIVESSSFDDEQIYDDAQREHLVDSSFREEDVDEEETPPRKNPTPRLLLDSDEDEDEEDERTPVNQKKPINANPNVNSRVPVTVLASPVASLANKRHLGFDTATPTKKAKRESLEGDESCKKRLFQRLFSEDDEIGILEGVIEFKVKEGVEPLTVPGELFEFINKTLHVDADRYQLLRKVKSLKKRFDNSKKIKKIVDPHVVKLFELSKKIWGDGNGLKSSGDVGKDSKVQTKKKEAGMDKLNGVTRCVSGVVFEDEEEEVEKLQDWVVSRRGKELKLDDFGNCTVLEEGMNLLDEEEKAELVEKWKKHSLEETELYLKKLDLLKELTQKILKTSNS